MTSTKRASLAFAGVLLACSGASAFAAGDTVAGKAVFTRINCASCHGADAKTPIDPSYPKLAGQYANYLAHALTAYQRGQANEPPSANVRNNPIMGAFAAQLSEKDIEDVAAYLASLPSELATRK
jgi:cytochrome c553